MNVQSIQSNYSAFAAIRCDGTVVVWGSPNDGGDSSAVQVSGVPKKTSRLFATTSTSTQSWIKLIMFFHWEQPALELQNFSLHLCHCNELPHFHEGGVESNSIYPFASRYTYINIYIYENIYVHVSCFCRWPENRSHLLAFGRYVWTRTSRIH